MCWALGLGQLREVGPGQDAYHLLLGLFPHLVDGTDLVAATLARAHQAHVQMDRSLNGLDNVLDGHLFGLAAAGNTFPLSVWTRYRPPRIPYSPPRVSFIGQPPEFSFWDK